MKIENVGEMIEEMLTEDETPSSVGEWANIMFGPLLTTSAGAARANNEMAELVHACVVYDCKVRKHVPFEEMNAAFKIQDEIADVTITLYRLADSMGMDLQKRINEKMKKNRARKWQPDGTGNGQSIKGTPND